MKTEQIVMCVVFLLLGMLLSNMLKSVCGCKVVEGTMTENQIEDALGGGTILPIDQSSMRAPFGSYGSQQ